MRKLIAFIGIFLFCIGCGEQRPADILPKEKFQEVMWDMIKTGEFLDGYVLFRDTTLDRNATTTAWYNKVYQLHNITKAEFEKSYAYYQDRPAVMKVMLDTLSKRQLAEAPKDTTALNTPFDSVPASTPSVSTSPQLTPAPSATPKDLPIIGNKRNLMDSIRRVRKLQRQERLQ